MSESDNLFDKAMPHRNDPPTPKRVEVKCRFCGTWHSKGRLARHVEAHKAHDERSTDGPGPGKADDVSEDGPG